MDADHEMARAKWVLITGALFLVSCFICFDEMAYLISGKETAATIAKVYESSSRRGTRLTVEYMWVESDGTTRKGMISTSTDWTPPADNKLPILYTSGADGRSRLLGHPAWIAIAFFFGTLGMVGFFVFRLVREAAEADQPRKRKKL